MVVAVAAVVPVAARVVMVAGATGLVGREVLAALSAAENIRAIHVVGRRAPDSSDARMRFHPVDFGQPMQLQQLPSVDEVYIALGTTIKVAGSQAAFRAVDHDAVVALARQARQQGAKRLAVVSAMGADASSRIFYNRVKGETEDALRALGFDTLVIARPSMIDGDRASLNQPGRPGEGLGLALMRRINSSQLPRHRRARYCAGHGTGHAKRQAWSAGIAVGPDAGLRPTHRRSCQGAAARHRLPQAQCPTWKSLRPVRSWPRSSHKGRDANATGTPDFPSTGLRFRSNTDVPGMYRRATPVRRWVEWLTRAPWIM